MRRTDKMQSLFDRIAPSYDQVTRVISMGRDDSWRRRSIEHLRGMIVQPVHVLDACCGTGEYTFGLACAFPDAAIVGADFSPAMLATARKKQENRPKSEQRATFERGDLNSLPFEDERFDLITVAFGLRNSIDYERSMSELVRVLAPGGLLSIVEITTPGLSPTGRLLSVYMRIWVPLAGWLLGGSYAQYRQLPQSLAHFGRASRIASDLTRHGLERVSVRSLFGDVVHQIAGWKPARGSRE